MTCSDKRYKFLTSAAIRKMFLDFFTLCHGHKFVRSSSVVPFGDPSVAFVNAGMNQFKGVFLGKNLPPHKRVCNSQKCIRVGGRHNDLSAVGHDSYHHTFFEMLGNWSFGDYFKKEACGMALDLLRGSFGINPERLYVTYFGGDKELGLPPDMECFNIWQSLGIPVTRILPFGSTHNFWEMGSTGPCGPCTEIHIDYHSECSDKSRANLVNCGLPDVVELWNLVFIQYNRNLDGSISTLPERHVDTGMGFERLTAVLQNKYSNYDTDLFVPIFDHIAKVAKAPKYGGNFLSKNKDDSLDAGYRILADHTRMIAICLADGMLPDHNQKLRRVIRKALVISEELFKKENLLQQLIPVVAEILGTAYPELCFKQNAILELINHEKEVFKELRGTLSKESAKILAEFPNLEIVDIMENHGFVLAYRDFISQKHKFENNVIPGRFLFKLSETYGITEECFTKLAETENMSLDTEGYLKERNNAKCRSKGVFTSERNCYSEQSIWNSLSILTKSLPSTDNTYKYFYKYYSKTKKYINTTVTTDILGILKSEKDFCSSESQSLALSDEVFHIISRCSNFYCPSGGQQCDRGTILIKVDDETTYDFHVMEVKILNDCVVHICRPFYGRSNKVPVSVGANICLIVDVDHRSLNIIHHTGTHLLNEAIRVLYNKVTYQVSSEVTRDCFKLELGLIGKRLNEEDIEDIENLIRKIIDSHSSVDVNLISPFDLMQQRDITVIPGESYPESNLRLITINNEKLKFHSKELCCGTHSVNTRELELFCVTDMKQTARARYSFTGVAGPVAKKVLKTADVIGRRIDILKQQCDMSKMARTSETQLQKIRNEILHSELLLPYKYKVKTIAEINEILHKLKKKTQTKFKEFLQTEMINILIDSKTPFIVHYFSECTDNIPLKEIIELCNNRPILLAGMHHRIAKARCFVPKEYTTTNFSAQLWLKEFASVFKAEIRSAKNQNAEEYCNMKGIRVIPHNFEVQLKLAMQKANNFAEMYFSNLNLIKKNEEMDMLELQNTKRSK